MHSVCNTVFHSIICLLERYSSHLKSELWYEHCFDFCASHLTYAGKTALLMFIDLLIFFSHVDIRNSHDSRNIVLAPFVLFITHMCL